MSIQLPYSAYIYVAVVLFAVGACAGSFTTCAADRYIRHESVLRGRSHCDSCGARLGAIDLIPIFGYLFLRGRCRKCGARIPIECLLAEVAFALIYLATYICYGFGFITLEYVALFTVLLAIFLIDANTHEIPDGLLLAGLVIFAIFLYPHGDYIARFKDGLLGAVAFGGGTYIISQIMQLILKRDTLGGGDIKLFALIGLFTGLAKGLLMLLMACVIGLIDAAALRGGKYSLFAFGPAISVAAIISLLVGQQIIDLYMTLCVVG